MMDAPLLNIVNTPDADGLAQVTASVISILQAGHDLRVSEVLMLSALDILANAAKSEMSVNGCSFNGDDRSVLVASPAA